MKKIILLFLLLPSLVMASPVSPDKAKKVATHFFENAIQENAVQRRKASFQRIEQPHSKKIRRAVGRSYEPYYIFNNTDGGFVIVAGDDRVQPILAYSADGVFAQENIPVQVQRWLDMYSEQIQFVVDNNISNDSIASLWTFTAPNRTMASEVVEPLIQTYWSQSPLYNNKCPYDADLSPLGSHPTVGCVACAMGQIMKYWEFPSFGLGSHSYNSANYGTLSANFGRTKYDWANMPERLTTSSTPEQIDAVSTLLYHCGVSVDMMYNCDGDGSSGAYTTGSTLFKWKKATAEEALVDYFGYKANTIKGVFMDDYTYDEWISLLKNELNNKRPILYTGAHDGSGHAFICDGYDDDDFFHFNWGWGGSYNGYFTLLTSSYPLILYPQSQNAVIGIIPDKTSQTYDLAMYADLQTASSTYTFGQDMSVTGQIENNGTGTFMGEFRVGLYNSNDEFVGWSNETYSVTLAKGNYTTAKTFTFTGGTPYITGKYTAYMFYRENGTYQWHPVRSDIGLFLTEYNNVSFTISYKTNSLRTYSAFSVAENKFVTGQSVHVNVDILNAGSSTFCGKIKLCLKQTDGSTAQDIDIYNTTSGLNANTHFSGGLDFAGTLTANPGTYYLTLLFQRTGETTWYYVGCDQYQNPTPVNVVAPPLVADSYEENDTQATSANIMPDFIEADKPTFGTGEVSLHTTEDIDYYKVDFPAGYKYYVTIDLYDYYNRNGIYHSGDVKLAYSLDGQTYSGYFDDGVSEANQVVFEGPLTMYIQVVPYLTDWIGTYELAGHVTREKIDDVPDDSQPDNGNYVVLAQRSATENWFYMTSDLGTAKNKRYQAVDAGTNSLASVSTFGLESKYYWRIEGNKLHTAAGYSTWTSGNTAILNETGKELTIEKQADGTYTFSFADGTNTRYLAFNKTDGNNYFAYYSGTNQIYKLTLVKEGKNGTTTAIEENESQPNTQTATKILRNGQILILRGDKTYTLQGQEVK